jgi:hypothetical protein
MLCFPATRTTYIRWDARTRGKQSQLVGSSHIKHATDDTDVLYMDKKWKHVFYKATTEGCNGTRTWECTTTIGWKSQRAADPAWPHWIVCWCSSFKVQSHLPIPTAAGKASDWIGCSFLYMYSHDRNSDIRTITIKVTSILLLATSEWKMDVTDYWYILVTDNFRRTVAAICNTSDKHIRSVCHW